MISAQQEIVDALAGVQAELRKIPIEKPKPQPLKLPPPYGNLFADKLSGMLSMVMGGKLLGSRLLHWIPEKQQEQPGVYMDLDARRGGHAHAFFEKLYKVRYRRPDQPRKGPDVVERQFGITYIGWDSKRKAAPALDPFKQCAAQAGELVGRAKEHLAAALPEETLAAKDDLHRWIYTVFDLAWKKPPESPLSAVRYIPVQAMDQFMRTDESIVYDLDSIRAMPWTDVVRRLDPNNRGWLDNLAGPYASWREQLPQYYASRIDDMVEASDWTIDWLIGKLARG
jgi:hypothetical protein